MVNAIAGPFSNVQGFGGDGGPAIGALFSSPNVGAVLPNGDIIIGDRGNNRIRRLFMANGTINTISGMNPNGYREKVLPVGNATTLPAQWQTPAAVTIHPITGAIIVVDNDGQRIRGIDPVNYNTWLIAGMGATGFGGDGGPATLAYFTYPLSMEISSGGVMCELTTL